MTILIKHICEVMVLLPLITSTVVGLWGKTIGRRWSHCLTIGGVAISFVLSLFILKYMVFDDLPAVDVNIYSWVKSGSFTFHVGFLVDRLSAMMMVLVTFVSTLVHLYSIGYMEEDPGYQRFFCYMSLFTFMMLMLVLANNFATLFFGWEGVGLVSYLLIGFWYTKPTAAFGSFKAFIANRVGDMGMILGIAAVFTYFGNLNYHYVFTHKDILLNQTITIIPGLHWNAVTVTCILLFIGAAGKSAQMPLHVWLPESMEGPTPISAMIHAATMVTAGVYMVSRFSPLFEMSHVALSVVLVLGATTCLFCGLLGTIQFDIKRVIAYSTLSQLGYMMAGVGASAFSAGMFHLFTHGCFKALLFLSAGLVIIANHHGQDMRKMGGLWRYMPITYITFLIGGLALSAIPPFAGFYSKDTIIDAVHHSTIPGSTYAYWCVLLGAFVTGLYTFRAFFMTFHTKEKIPADVKPYVKESRWVVTVPLILLAIPSTVIGFLFIKPLIYGNAFGKTLFVLPKYNVIAKMAPNFYGAFRMLVHAPLTAPFWLAISGVAFAFYITIIQPAFAEMLKKRFSWVYYMLVKKYGFDDFNQIILVDGTRRVGDFMLRVLDVRIIDEFFVNGSGRLINLMSRVVRHVQTGYVYHYAFAMIIGVFVFLGWRLL